MPEVVFVALVGTGTMLATGLGAIPVWALGSDAARWRPLMIGIAIGAMVVAAIVGLIAPGLDLGKPTDLWIGFAVGAAVVFAIRSLLRNHDASVGELRSADIRRAILVFGVLFVHSLPEGFAVGTAWASSDEAIGIFVILAITLQNIPEGMSVALPLNDAGIGFWRQFWAAVGTSLPQPIGAVVAFVLVDSISGLLPFSFGFAAGAMLVLVAVEMIPDAHRSGNRNMAAVGALVGGVGIWLLELAVA
jgi:ZIP family zinc transporter